MEQWLEVTIRTASGGIDLLCAELTEAGFDSFVIDDSEQFRQFLDGARAYWDYVDEKLAARMRDLSQVRLYLPEETAEAQLAELRALLAELGIDIPTYGMVKDEHHKTRALTDGTHDISIAREQSVFVFVYGLQEEVHRYSVGRMSVAKRKTLTHSVLENVRGIGAAKANKYLKAAGSLAKLKAASVGEMAAMGIPEKDAAAIAAYFAGKTEKKGN